MIRFIKSIIYVIFFAVVFTNNIYAGEIKNDSTFSGLDYYYYRITEGFGGGLHRYIGPKYKTYQYFKTNVLFNSGFKNTTNCFDININYNYLNHVQTSNAKNEYFTLSDKKNLDFTVRYRLFNFLQLKYTESAINNLAYLQEYEGSAQTLSLLYISKKGRIALTPEQRIWLYYFDNDLSQDKSYRFFLSPGQLFVQSYIILNNINNNYHISTNIPFMNSQCPENNYTYNLNFAYNFDHSILWGAGIKIMPSLAEQFDYKDNMIIRDPDLHAVLNKKMYKSWDAESWLNILSSRRIMHQFIFSLRNDKVIQVYSNYGLFQQDNSKSQFHLREYMLRSTYVFSFLNNTSAPSLNRYLANWNGFFQNLLPRKGLLVQGKIYYHRNWAQSRFNSPKNLTVSYPDNKLNVSHSANFELLTRYGIFNWLQGSVRLGYNYMFISGNLDDPKSGDWNKQISLRFSNYHYSRKYHKQYSWTTVSNFDYIYGPLLQPGMINGGVHYKEYCVPDEIYGKKEPTHQIITVALNTGIIKGLEWRISADTFKEIQTFTFQDTAWQGFIKSTLIWQLRSRLRFFLTYTSSNRYEKTINALFSNPAWNLGITGYFN